MASSGRILLVDDDGLVARALGKVLGKEGYTVEAASNGKIAVEILRGEQFDVVLSDISMPAMSGLELLRAVREYDLDVPVLLMTGSPDVKTAVKALEHGALRYLIKPIEGETLLTEVASAVRLGRMARLKREALALVGDVGKFVGDRAGLESRFSRSLGCLQMVYQPIVRWSTKEIYAHEALLRSDEPSLRHPGALIDAAERLQRLPELGRAIRGAVSKRLPELPARLFVNLHARDLVDERLYSPDSPLTSHADRVTLEVTERASLDDLGDLHERMAALRHLGFRIALDDLGAGYSGLNSFTQLQPDVVKLDLTLIRDLDHEPTKQRIVGAMITLCRELAIEVVAEGVEQPAERDVLVRLGCDLFQGFLFARPGPAFPTATF